MTMGRRQFLATSAAATILPSLGTAKYYEHNLVAEPIVTSLVPGYDFRTEMLFRNHIQIGLMNLCRLMLAPTGITLITTPKSKWHEG
jgi:hypothetical protein